MLIKDPSRLNQRAEFGTVGSTDTINGNSKSHFSGKFTLWCAVYVRTINQQYRLTGTSLEDTVTLIIRHNKNVLDTMHVKLNNKEYRIISITPDMTPSPIAYDTVTIKDVMK